MSSMAKDIAEYLIAKSEIKDEGHDMSHLKLQKMLYYCQGFHLAMTDEPLFEESIYHWDHGPVVKEIYESYKGTGSSPLTSSTNRTFAEFEKMIGQESLNIVDEVYNALDKYSAWQLRNATHLEDPWKETSDCDEINRDSLVKYFKTRID